MRYQLQQAIAEAERGIAAGRWVLHGELEARLKRWACPQASLEIASSVTAWSRGPGRRRLVTL